MATPKSAKKTAKKRPVRTTVIKAEYETLKSNNEAMAAMLRELSKSDVAFGGSINRASMSEDTKQNLSRSNAPTEPLFRTLCEDLRGEINRYRSLSVDVSARVRNISYYSGNEMKGGERADENSLSDVLKNFVSDMQDLNADLENTNNHLATLV